MSENDFSKNFNALLEMQNQYMEMWKKAAQENSGTEEDPTESASTSNADSLWGGDINNFWTTMFGQESPASTSFNPFASNILQQNQFLSQLTQCFETLANASTTRKQQTPEDWQTFIDKTLGDLQAQLMKMNSTPFAPPQSTANLWSGPLSFWQQSIQAQPFADLAQAANATTGSGFDTGAGPGLGPNREKYEKLQMLQEALNQYQKAQEEYSESFASFWSELIEQFKTAINNVTDDEELSSIQSLYNLWIDSAEKTYAQTTTTEGYQELYSELINASMLIKSAIDDIQEESLLALNIPTRKEIDTLSERLQRTRRENRQLRAELDELKAAFANNQKAATKKVAKKTVKKKSTKKKHSAKKSSKNEKL